MYAHLTMIIPIKDLEEAMKKFRLLDGLILLLIIPLWYNVMSFPKDISNLDRNITNKFLNFSNRFESKIERVLLNNRVTSHVIRTKNSKQKFIKYTSPIILTKAGVMLLKKYRLITYIKKNYTNIASNSKLLNTKSKFKLQNHIRNLFFKIKYSSVVEDTIENAAYDNGVEADDIKGYMAIYFRDTYFKQLKL